MKLRSICLRGCRLGGSVYACSHDLRIVVKECRCPCGACGLELFGASALRSRMIRAASGGDLKPPRASRQVRQALLTIAFSRSLCRDACEAGLESHELTLQIEARAALLDGLGSLRSQIL